MPFDREVHIRRGACLPHWTKEGAIYAVCFRLYDSLPQEKLQALREERKEIAKGAQRAGRSLTTSELRRLDYLYSEKIEQFLAAGYGSCFLQRDDIAQVVADTLRHFQDARYHLYAWCIMPNHVHVVVQPWIEHSLRDIVYSWKKFTAVKANKILGRSGPFWQSEPFDHLIRNDESFERWIEYTWGNPELAGLKNWKWRWSAGAQSGSTPLRGLS